MQLITHNPYRMLGLLVGASAMQLNRHRTRIPNYISAGDNLPAEFTDYSFDKLGNIDRTVESVTDAASKLNLDSDKMNAALFWFYKGNQITDEPAFDAIKDGDLSQVLDIWRKLTATGEPNQRNASAYHNLGTLYLSGVMAGTHTNEHVLEQGISLKLKFLESDFIKDFKALATDETYKTTKKDLQLLFLNQIQSEVDKNKAVSSQQFLEIINKQTFSAKDDFLKGFVQKPIEQIEKKIEEANTKRKANRANLVNIGKNLLEQTSENLKQVKSILGTSNIKYSSIADKVATEILQCSIDYFNHCQENESDIDYFEHAYKLAKSTESIAVGKPTKDRITESLNTLDEMKEREISQAIEVLQSIKEAYETNEEKMTTDVKSMPLSSNQSINWTKVNEMIAESLDWNKVVELIQKTIPLKNIAKIKNVKNPAKLNEYKTLVNFLMNKLSYSYKHQLKYLCYWESIYSERTETVPKVSDYERDEEFIFAKNAWWILGVSIALLAGILAESSRGGAGFMESLFPGFIIGAIIGFIIKKIK